MTFQSPFAATFPWLTFELNFHRFDPGVWIMLGECQAKCEHIAGVPLRPETAERLHFIYLAKGVLATTAMEGNTLSEDEVVRHLEGKLTLSPSREYLRQEIENILGGCNEMLDDIRNDRELLLDSDRIKYLNVQVLKGLELGEGIVPGEIRTHDVRLTRYKIPPASGCDLLLRCLSRWLDSDSFNPPDPRLRIASAILKAIVAHLYLAWIHPFGDGNGRTARLLEVQILLLSGLPTATAHLLSIHYNQTRAEYYRQLDRASRSGGDIILFLRYAVEGLLDGLVEQSQLILDQQLEVAWIHYVHQRFIDKGGPANVRRRRLVLDLSRKDEPIPLKDMADISPRITRAYLNKTSRTLLRDLNYLLREELIKRDRSGGYRPNRAIIQALLSKSID